MHGHRAIVLLQPYMSTVDRGPPREQTANDAICVHMSTTRTRGWSIVRIIIRTWGRCPYARA